MGWLRRVFGLEPKTESEIKVTASTTTDTQYSYPTGLYDGSNFWGGVQGQVDEVAALDYWALRQRSAALFYTNSYGRGIIRRMVTDIIHAGLEPEATPEEKVLGLPEDSLQAWTEDIETRWRLYGTSKDIVDYKGRREEGELQAQIYMEALVEGDCLVVNRIDSATGLPQIEIVNGGRVRTPTDRFMEEDLVDGVKLDKRGRHLGYWVAKGTNEVFDDRFEYIPAFGAKSGRRVAWMVYGPDKREDGVRGEPLLSIAIQPLNEISDYRGNTQLKKKINAMVALVVEKDQDVPSSRPITGGAVKRGTVTADTTGATTPIQFNQLMPGMIVERLQPGEKMKSFVTNGTDDTFGDFEAAIMVGLAWSLQIPPEILLMSFNKNYSASQAAKGKWQTYITKERPRFAAQHCKNHYEEWLTASVLAGDIQAAGFIDAAVDPRRYAERQAWLLTEWWGQVEPTVDVVKQVTGAKTMVAEGWSTNARVTRELNGSKWSHNIKRLIKENQLKADAMRPLLELQNEYGQEAVTAMLNAHPEIIAAHLLAAAQDEREIES